MFSITSADNDYSTFPITSADNILKQRNLILIIIACISSPLTSLRVFHSGWCSGLSALGLLTSVLFCLYCLSDILLRAEDNAEESVTYLPTHQDTMGISERLLERAYSGGEKNKTWIRFQYWSNIFERRHRDNKRGRLLEPRHRSCCHGNPKLHAYFRHIYVRVVIYGAPYWTNHMTFVIRECSRATHLYPHLVVQT